jgi:hypothetical protein
MNYLAEMIISAFGLVSEATKVLLSTRSTADVVTRVFSIGDSVKNKKPEIEVN